ncbi:hypothetical protein TB2_027735 [Malus domestica]|uniref:uncharacterized protein n=1 Tax=Malus domestica TaxID=3750 RepID=UPI0039770B0C
MVSCSISEEFRIDRFGRSVCPILNNSDKNVRSITFSQVYQAYQKEFHISVRFESSFGKGLVKIVVQVICRLDHHLYAELDGHHSLSCCSLETTYRTTILGAIKSAVNSSTEVIYSENPDRNFVKSNNFAYAIVVVGEHPYAETAGDSPNLMMAEPGPSVISNVCESVKCIVILITGKPIVIEPYISSIDALVAAWLPGSEGQGITDVLFGDHGFSGKLPRTWFRTVDQLPMNVGDSNHDPLFPFGFGLETESVKELVTRSTSAGVVARPCMLIVMVALILSL